MSLKKQGKYRFHDFEVDLAHRSLRRAGHTITIGSRTFDLLAFLVLKPQRVITTEELMDALWPDSTVEESNLSQHIFLLRKALTGAKPGDKLLVTIPGRGYQFAPPVTEVHESDSHLADDSSESLVAARDSDSAIVPQAGLADPTPRFDPKGHAGSDATDAPVRFPVQGTASDGDDTEEDGAVRGTSRGFFAGFRHPGPWHVTILTAIAAALGFAALFLWHSTHRVLPDSLSMVLADFDNTTNNPQFDPALKTALTIDLQQSPYLRVATAEQITAQFPQKKAADSPSTAPRLTATSAREACQRLSGQIYLTGAIRGFSQQYLITIRAFRCSDDKSLGVSRGIAKSPDAVVAVLDKVAVDLRKQLGEPSQSVTGFSQRLFADRAPSLDALASYSDARLLRLDGKLEASLTLLQHAVEVDPQFALAFAELGALYTDLGQREPAIAALTRAFELRSSVDEPHRLQIVATYNDLVTGDILASIHNYKDWSDEYPRNPEPLVSLANREIQIGKPGLALEPAQRALKLNPSDGSTYAILARTQLSLGQFAAAANTCQLAIDRQLDGQQIHGVLLQIAFLHLDQPSIDTQISWAKDSAAAPYMLMQQALMDFAQGKAKTAEEVFADAVDAYRKQGQSENVSQSLSAMPRIEADLGLTEIAYALLTHMPENSASNGSNGTSELLTGGSSDIPVAWAQAGETARAQTLLKSELDAHPTNTLWQQDFAPQIKAAIALNQQRPEDAIDDLKPAVAFDLRSFDVPALRGRAYLAAKQPELAEAEFHKVLDHPGVEALSHNYPLAQLGLARALAQQGKTAEAGFAYKVVLQIWKDADTDLPRLKEAKAEYAKLTGLPIKTKATASSHSASKPLASRR
jgi:eukaryotic-like serine/threonine-protein kinase